MSGFWLMTAAQLVQDGLFALAVLAYLAIAHDVVCEIRGQ